MRQKTHRRKSQQGYPILWCTLNIHGSAWEVWISSDAVTPKLKGNEGYCDCRTSKIYIAAHLQEDRKRDVLIHEILHAEFHLTGVQALLGRETDQDWEEREEQMILLLAVNMFDTLQRNGMLKMPKLPRLPESSAADTADCRRGIKCRPSGPKTHVKKASKFSKPRRPAKMR